MNKEKEKWIEDVFQSMKGAQRAKPRPELFNKIENQIYSSNAKIIQNFQWRSYAAAVILLLLINTMALISYNKNREVQNARYC